MAEAPFYAEPALLALLDALDEGALVFDGAYRCRAAGWRAAELCGVEQRALLGVARGDIVARFAAGCTDPGTVTATLAADALGDGSTTLDPIEVARPHVRKVVWSSVPVLEGGRRVGRVDVIRDVTRERHAEQASEALSRRLEEVSTVDEATGLVNRRGFERDADREHRRSQRAWLPYAVVRLRVEGLAAARAKQTADELFRRVGAELRAARREYDVVARWDDDGIVMLLPGADANSTGLILQRSIMTVTDATKELVDGPPLTVGAAVWIPPSGDGAVDMIRRAGDALDVALARGPGEVEIDTGFSQLKDDIEV